MKQDRVFNVNDAIWQQMKADAIEWAESDDSLPTAEECLEHVARVAKDLLPEYCTFPVEARTFYASEFQRMVSIRRENVIAPAPHRAAFNF